MRRGRSYQARKRRTWRRFKRRAINKIGYSPRAPTPVRTWVSLPLGDVTNFNTDTLYCAPLFDIPQRIAGSTDQTFQNGRDRGFIMTKGVRFRLNFKNVYKAGQTPLYVNFVIISENAYNEYRETGTPLYRATTAAKSDFFRHYGGADRGENFDAATLSGINRHTTPVNTDKWRIIYHKRFQLGVKSTENLYASGENKNYKTWSKWFPIKRQLRFEGPTANLGLNRIWCFWWCSGFHQNAITPVPEPGMQVIGDAVSFYRT